MRIILEMSSEKEIILPIQYNHILQGFIYNNLSDKNYREFIHSQGYQLDNKRFKLFTFSRLLGKFNIYSRANKIGFASPIKLVISSAVEQFITDLAETLIKAEFLFFGSNQIVINSISVEKQFEFTETMQVKMLSPVVAYSTENKFTHYYSPWHPRFNEIITQNLIDKYITLFGCTPQNQTFKMIPNGMQEKKFKIMTSFKDTIIEGYNGIYFLKGNPELIDIAYHAGLGSKNAQGFGCWEVMG